MTYNWEWYTLQQSWNKIISEYWHTTNLKQQQQQLWTNLWVCKISKTCVKNHAILRSTRVTQLLLKLILFLIIFHCLSLLKCYEEADVFRDVLARAFFVTCTHSHVWYQPALCPKLLLNYSFVVLTFTQADLCPFFIWLD